MKKQTEEERGNKDGERGKMDETGKGRKKNLIQFQVCRKCRLSQPTFLACAAASSDR